MGEEEVYHPGDPGRKEFEDKWMLAGGKLEELEGQIIRVENTEVVKVSPFHVCCLCCTFVHAHHLTFQPFPKVSGNSRNDKIF